MLLVLYMPPSVRACGLLQLAMPTTGCKLSRITSKLASAALTPAKFVARCGSTEEAIEKEGQRWLLTQEGRLHSSGN